MYYDLFIYLFANIGTFISYIFVTCSRIEKDK